MKNTLTPLVAILRGIRPEELDSHLPLLIDAGFEAIEIPLNSPEWETSLTHALKTYGPQATIGAGTVLSVAQVDRLARLGCPLILAPDCNPAVIKRALAHQMQILPGCATPTEAFSALNAGARVLKIFPASLFGPDYVRALKAVLPPDSALFAVGGVTPETLTHYLEAGCAGAGLGSDLYRAGQSPDRTRKQAQAFITAWQSFVARQHDGRVRA